jgi:hypothetical protein
MNRDSEEAYASGTQPGIDEQPGPTGVSPSAAIPATTVNLNFVRGWRQPQGVGVGTAVVLTAGASVATLVYMRRRARARVRRLARLALKAAIIRAALPRAARGAATFGGLGGTLLAAALLRRRMRKAQTHSGFEELSGRVAALQAQVETQRLSARPRPRDVVLGAVAGLGLAGLIARASSSRKSS